MIKSFKDLVAWKEAHSLAISIYKLTANLPKKELFGLANQLQRAAVSIPSNIAEGFNRISVKEKIQFYSIAHGSVAEVQSQLLIAKDVGYIDNSVFEELDLQAEKIHKIITGLIKSTRSRL